MLLYTQLCLQCSALALVYLDRMRRQCFIPSFFLIFFCLSHYQKCPLSFSFSPNTFDSNHILLFFLFSRYSWVATIGQPIHWQRLHCRECNANRKRRKKVYHASMFTRLCSWNLPLQLCDAVLVMLLYALNAFAIESERRK